MTDVAYQSGEESKMRRLCVKLGIFVVVSVVFSWGTDITSFTTRLVGFGPYIPGAYGFALVLEPAVYTNNDGSTWNSGAGAFAPGLTQVSSASVGGGIVQYRLSPISTSFSWAPQLGSGLFMFQEYDYGTHSTRGYFSAVGPSILIASIGSPDATLNGFLSVNANPSNGNPDFEYFAAPVGSIVPFSETFQLQMGDGGRNT